jgi:hypothetical protein
VKWEDADEWIPADGRVYVVCDAINRVISFGVHLGDNQWELMAIHEMTADVCITHWMELPEMPESED